ncbi:DUF559 domain-containing protein [Patescibacteria group bacterium]|nr:DUF559 domain-containing protein [Patescibacteria group bacterium]MBU2220241.1 DUF559 domain-containing protein [Patescibacteria group bacterium]MBU2264647.1 DUF559 domain-containing protein [Patescibacteria group bacterium]
MKNNFIFNQSSLKDRRRDLRKSSTDAEKKLWKELRGKRLFDFKFFRQYSVGLYILDFYCPMVKLGIELDGGQHADESQEVYDKVRTDYLKKHDIRVLRFWNNDVLKNIEGVVLKIIENLTPPKLSLALPTSP